MSTPNPTTPTAQWIPAETFLAMGFRPYGPEIDYGMRWGEQHNIRVSYAPHRDRDGGFLYAHDPATDSYALLRADTIPGQIEATWQTLIAEPPAPQAFPRFTDPGTPMAVRPARRLLMHCLERELAAYADYAVMDVESPYRFDAARAVVIARSARVAAEDLLVDACRAPAQTDSVVVRYRVLGRPDWTGRLAADSLDAVAGDLRRTRELATEHGLTVQATSAVQGATTVSAARVPELAFASERRAAQIEAPTFVGL